MNLIHKAKNIFCELNFKQLQYKGMERENIKISSHSHHIVTYPPLDSLPLINPSKIYSKKTPSKKREVALYLHLPFCTGKCLYCAYVSFANQSKKFIDKYINAIESEIRLLLEYPINQDIIINSVYIGGGTPTYLTAQQLERVFNILKTNSFIKKKAEFTVEASPETLITKDGKKKLHSLLQNGANRLSIGGQTFNSNILKLIGRRHNSSQTLEAYKLSKEIGFENINIDLIPGLPEQTLKIWQNDIEMIDKLEPASVTCYPLSIKQNAAIWSMYQNDRRRFPSRENIILMHIMATELFSNLGYSQRPIWWFIRSPKYVYKQQVHKWSELGEQIALGVSGYSFVNNFQYFNFRNIQQYLEATAKNTLPIWKGIKLNKEELMRRMILFGLKTGLNKELFESKFGKKPKNVFIDVWEKLENLGLIKEDRNTIKLSYIGKLFADEVSREFFNENIKGLIENKKPRLQSQESSLTKNLHYPLHL